MSSESSDIVAWLFLQLNSSNVVHLLADKGANGRFHFNETDHLVDNSCQINSLEVYRGREQAIEISHEGFSLTQNGSVEVQISMYQSNLTNMHVIIIILQYIGESSSAGV